ncbi:BQ2448_725 [Microbotryum intermedium]|uniref:BQ2448_725 protein n=1 Tax=Microbotryum intermedium TaxID=269621 RepID=A0A238F9R1_9BASI|nr:BQ2448_725 [Microbotryum intermedium]
MSQPSKPTVRASAAHYPTSTASHDPSRAAAGTSTSSSSALDRPHSPDRMLNRPASRGGKSVEDEVELLERGDQLRLQMDEQAWRKHNDDAAAAYAKGDDHEDKAEGTLSMRDRKALTLLIALYLLQGIPVGLAFGSIPFLLRAKLSYSQIGLFTLCTYPYSLKLLWSPIVDSFFSPKLGRRKSWIVPIQLIVGCMLFWMGGNVQQLMDVDEPNVQTLTILFFTLVFFAATQDIAVDGWALTLLSKDNLSYASTAQTIGLNTGYFLSFTVFLAFNSLEFSNKYFRLQPLDYPLVTLSGYLQFWGLAFIVVTLYLAFFQPEDPVSQDDPDMDVKKVYSIMYEICKLKRESRADLFMKELRPYQLETFVDVQTFVIVHLVTKLGTATNDAATSLKLLEKGLKKEDLALAVLIDFPFQILFGYLAAKWSKGDKPLKPWLLAMWTRLGWAIASMLLIKFFPQGNISTSYFWLVVFCTVGSGFSRWASRAFVSDRVTLVDHADCRIDSSTVQFVGISSFHTQIADPLIGGTYMTLLNTVSNLGGTWPRYFVLKGVDAFSTAVCEIKNTSLDVVLASEFNKTNPVAFQHSSPDINFITPLKGQECVSDHGKAACADLGGTCHTTRDGYYWVSSACIIVGAFILISFIQPASRRLQSLPASAWRVKKPEKA